MTDDRGAPEREPERIRETERTTVIHTDRGDRGGGVGLVVGAILLVAVLALLFFFLRGGLGGAADKVGVNVNVDAPDINVPTNVTLPDVDLDTGTGNKS